MKVEIESAQERDMAGCKIVGILLSCEGILGANGVPSVGSRRVFWPRGLTFYQGCITGDIS
jgi:hypothetical protein